MTPTEQEKAERRAKKMARRRARFGPDWPWDDTFTPSPKGWCRMMPGGEPEPLEDPKPPPKPVKLPDDAATLLPRFWRFAAKIWEEITGLLGGDSLDQFHRRVMPRHEGRVLAGWIANLEHFVRRVIVIAALALKLEPLPFVPPGIAGPRSKPQPKEASIDDPSTWNVSFRIVLHRAGQRRRRRKRAPQGDFMFVGGLAFRIEALRRAIANRDIYAKRFARRVARLCAANARTNRPEHYRLGRWEHQPPRLSGGQRAILEEMKYAQPLAVRDFNHRFWQEPG